MWGFLLCRKNGIENIYVYVLLPSVRSSDYVSLMTGKTREVSLAYGKLLLSWVGGMLSNSKPP